MALRVPIFLFLILSVLWAGSCRKDFEYAPSAGNLFFSKDTVYLDTIFSSIGSSTYSLKVYNRSQEDILIPSVQLRNGVASGYRLNVDGAAGKSFQNIPVYAEDSLFIFIETTVDLDPTNNEVSILYTDAILFDSGENRQEVELVTLVRDAIFMYPSTNPDGARETVVLTTDEDGNEIEVQGFGFADDQLRFSNEKPYVIYGYGVVPEGKELIIDAGARVHFHKDSGILVKNGATLSVNGALSEDPKLLEREVIFEGDRLEPAFSDLPGQWSSIYIQGGSTGNTINYLTIKNASMGLYVEGDNTLTVPTLTITNSQVHNSLHYNIWGRNAFITAKNIVLGSAGSASLYCNWGGNYSFVHTTIANYWNKGFRNVPALVIDNFKETAGATENSFDLIKADFKNCIIDGNNALELLLRANEENAFHFNFSNCMIKFNDTQDRFSEDSLYDFETNAAYSDIIRNGEADFFDPDQNDFGISLESAAVHAGDPEIAAEAPLDILGKDRSETPDLGAFQARAKDQNGMD
ncbi:hypothetical protein [Maribacter sp. 2304DJ31-5]|uniref:hypothetical protein n=1 Tax=Maribacter sp. 2304DJ31-5 TaxID=3386273 RepID=UPI0039BD5363